MKRDTEKTNADQAHDPPRAGGRSTTGTGTKRAWVQRYADRMFALWLERQTCLGVTRQYLEQLREDLARWYDEPLKRTFIEATY